jgi:hypothetical protein
MVFPTSDQIGYAAVPAATVTDIPSWALWNQ